MKKNIFLTLLLIISVTSFSQQPATVTPAVKTDYLKKSKNQNTTAWILLGGGFAFASTGIILGINGAAEEIAGIFTGEKSNKLEVGAVFFIQVLLP